MKTEHLISGQIHQSLDLHPFLVESRVSHSPTAHQQIITDEDPTLQLTSPVISSFVATRYQHSIIYRRTGAEHWRRLSKYMEL